GVTVFLDSNGNGKLDNGPTKSYPSSNVPVAIPDQSTGSSTLTVSDVGLVADINVTLNISHTYDSDLVLTLTAPTRLATTVAQNSGGSGDNFAPTVYADQAATAIAAGAAPFNGSFQPAPGKLSSFNNLTANGTWTLKAQDTAAQDSGTINSWSVQITLTGEPV